MHRAPALGSALCWAAATGFVVSLAGWVALLCTDIDLVVVLIVTATAGTLAAVLGSVGVWVHRHHTAVSLLVTAWYAVVVAVLLAAVVTNVTGALEGGWNSIGGGLLLIVGAVVTVAATGVAAALGVASGRAPRVSAPEPGAPSTGARSTGAR